MSRKESNHNNTVIVGSNEDVLLNHTDSVAWKVLDHVPLNVAVALLNSNDGYLIHGNNTYFESVNNTYFVTVGTPSTLNRSKEGLGTTDSVDVHSTSDDDDDTDSDPVSSISNDNRDLKCQEILKEFPIQNTCCPLSTYQSMTTINDFFPLSSPCFKYNYYN